MCAHTTTFKKYFSRKPALNALVLLNNIIPVFKKAKSPIIEPTLYNDFLKFTSLPAVCLMDGRMAGRLSQPACLPAVSPGCTKCRASKITKNNGLPHPIYENVILKTIIPLRHGDSFVVPSNAFFYTH